MQQSNIEDSRETDVYRRGAYSYQPREAQGEVIVWLKEHANTKIANEDATSMNCAIFTDLMYVCNYIHAAENIAIDRVYPALCAKGRDRCYHETKVNRGDVFTNIAELTRRGMLSFDSPSKMASATNTVPIFNDVRTKKFRTTKQTLAIAVENACGSGIKTSHLNLYHTLSGLKYLVENESMYNSLIDEPLFEDALRPLRKADIILEERRAQLQAWMDI